MRFLFALSVVFLGLAGEANAQGNSTPWEINPTANLNTRRYISHNVRWVITYNGQGSVFLDGLSTRFSSVEPNRTVGFSLVASNGVTRSGSFTAVGNGWSGTSFDRFHLTPGNGRNGVAPSVEVTFFGVNGLGRNSTNGVFEPGSEKVDAFYWQLTPDAAWVLGSNDNSRPSIKFTGPGDQVGVVPEPSTYALMGTGLGLVALVARRRKQK